ncbi:MAG TPA: hypothetical protein DD433_06575, partial [Ruminococcaceae bacterium]|nr:hypothetical protein [Oscillospiraceae bacterium]
KPFWGGALPGPRRPSSVRQQKTARLRNSFHNTTPVKQRPFRYNEFLLRPPCTKTGERSIIVSHCAGLSVVYGGVVSLRRGRGAGTPLPCPHNANGVCDSQEKVLGYDNACLKLCGLRDGQSLSWRAFQGAVGRAIARHGLTAICPGCQWLSLCLRQIGGKEPAAGAFQ